MSSLNSLIPQVLYVQTHRKRALALLSDFLDLGLWAVNQSLIVNIYPFVLKLLQSTDSTNAEVKKYLINIWSKVLVVENVSFISLEMMVNFVKFYRYFYCH